MLSEKNWIRTPHILPDHRGPVDRHHRRFVDPAIAPPIIDMLQSVALEHKDRVAIYDDDGPLNYGQLLSAIERFRDQLESFNLSSGPVGILLPATAHYAIAMFGSLAAGVPCLLMDDTFPDSRNAEIAAATGTSLIVTSPERNQPAAWPGVIIHSLARGSDDSTGAPAIVTSVLGLDEPAFILSTSGSSGTPKAIVHSQRSMLNWARTSHDALHVRPDDRVLSVSSLSSLGGFTALLSYPLAGASIQMFDIKKSGLGGLLETLASQPITILRAAPSLLRTCAILPEAREMLAGLRVVQTYGEPLLKADVLSLRAILPADCRIRSTYGSTEASGLSWFAGDPDDCDSVRVASGCLMPDTAAAIVDDEGEPCATGEEGELLIRSRYNALGEWSLGRVLAGQLIPHPSGDGTRVFKTGDIARYHEDGVFVVLGRKDRMVKINGQRIEPAEIEVVLRRIPKVKRAEIVAYQNSSQTRLVAFVVPEGSAGPSLVAELRRELHSRLPAFMVPSRIVLVTSIPLLPGGKIDTIAMLKIAEKPAAPAS